MAVGLYLTDSEGNSYLAILIENEALVALRGKKFKLRGEWSGDGKNPKKLSRM